MRHTESVDELLNYQFDFKKERSTVDYRGCGSTVDIIRLKRVNVSAVYYEYFRQISVNA